MGAGSDLERRAGCKLSRVSTHRHVAAIGLEQIKWQCFWGVSFVIAGALIKIDLCGNCTAQSPTLTVLGVSR